MGAGGGDPRAPCGGSSRWPTHPGGGLWIRSHFPQPAEQAPPGEPPMHPSTQPWVDCDRHLLSFLLIPPQPTLLELLERK